MHPIDPLKAVRTFWTHRPLGWRERVVAGAVGLGVGAAAFYVARILVGRHRVELRLPPRAVERLERGPTAALPEPGRREVDPE